MLNLDLGKTSHLKESWSKEGEKEVHKKEFRLDPI